MYPSSGKVWKELVRWDEHGRKETGMSGYILCQVKKAEKPFYIENISTNIYSIEELCYYLYNNLYLVDSSSDQQSAVHLARRRTGSAETCGKTETLYRKRGRTGRSPVSGI